MNRSIPQLLDQRISQLPQRRVYTASIYKVLFPSRQFVVNFPGHSRIVAEVGRDVNLGTPQYPLVTRGMNCTVTLDETTGHWVAEKPVQSLTCIPTSPSHVPNIPLPIYQPPVIYIPTPPISYPPLPGLPPISMPLPPFIPPVSMPPVTFSPGSVRLSWGDGFYGAIGTGITQQFSPAVTVEAMKVDTISAYSDVTDIIIELFLTDGAYADYVLPYRTFDGKWQVEHHDPATGALIGTPWLSPVTNTVNAHKLTGADIITIPSGTLIHADVFVGLNAVVIGVAYGCGGY